MAAGFVTLVGAVVGVAYASSKGKASGAHYANQPYFSGLPLAQQQKFMSDLFAQYQWYTGPDGKPWPGSPIASAKALEDGLALGEAASNFALAMMTSPTPDELNGVIDAAMVTQAAQDK